MTRSPVRSDLSFAAIALGQFYPTTYLVPAIADELGTWLRQKGIYRSALKPDEDYLPIAVRGPDDHIEIATSNPDVNDWHRDGITPPQSSEMPILKWMIVWSNRMPTEIRTYLGGERFYFEAFDVILFDNRRCKHRCPPVEEGRWFARVLEPLFEDDPCMESG